jgi:hypothetical protein
MAREALGEIQATSLYTLAEVQRRLGLGRNAVRQWRRKGLEVHYLGRCAYVHGAELIDFVLTHSDRSRSAAGQAYSR